MAYLTWVIRVRYDGKGCFAATNHQSRSTEKVKCRLPRNSHNTAVNDPRGPSHARCGSAHADSDTYPCDLINVIQIKQNGHSPRLRAEPSRSHTTHHILFYKLASRIALGREPTSYSGGPLPQTFCAHSPEECHRRQC